MSDNFDRCDSFNLLKKGSHFLIETTDRRTEQQSGRGTDLLPRQICMNE